MLPLADAVVGTGRGLMEAASFGKVLMTPWAGGPHPALVTRNNFQEFMNTNFSPRNRADGLNPATNFEMIRTALSEAIYRDEQQRFSRWLFEKHFDVRAAVPALLSIYWEAVHSRESRQLSDRLDLLHHATYVAKRLYGRAARSALRGRLGVWASQ